MSRLFNSHIFTEQLKSGVFSTFAEVMLPVIKDAATEHGYVYVELDGNQISSKQQFLEMFGHRLKYPAKFYVDWDFFASELRGLDWISKKGIVIVYRDYQVFQQAYPDDFKILLQIVYEVVRHRTYMGGTHAKSLYFVFHSGSKTYIPFVEVDAPFVLLPRPSKVINSQIALFSSNIYTERLKSGVFRTYHSQTLQGIKDAAPQHDYSYIELDGRQISTKEQFFELFMHTLEYPEELYINWDWFSDQLSDLEWISSQGIVIVYRDFQVFQHAYPDDFQILSEIVYDTIRKKLYRGILNGKSLYFIFHSEVKGVIFPPVEVQICHPLQPSRGEWLKYWGETDEKKD